MVYYWFEFGTLEIRRDNFEIQIQQLNDAHPSYQNRSLTQAQRFLHSHIGPCLLGEASKGLGGAGQQLYIVGGTWQCNMVMIITDIKITMSMMIIMMIIMIIMILMNIDMNHDCGDDGGDDDDHDNRDHDHDGDDDVDVDVDIDVDNDDDDNDDDNDDDHDFGDGDSDGNGDDDDEVWLWWWWCGRGLSNGSQWCGFPQRISLNAIILI